MQAVKDRPWFTFWPGGVPHHIEYPEIPLFRFLEDSTEKYPNNVAFIHENKSLTYCELNEQTYRLAKGLNRLGVKKGDRVVLLLHNNLEFVISYYRYTSKPAL
jgi:long-chain acyl-CoA synthetase